MIKQYKRLACQFCGEPWTPPDNVSAMLSYCDRCSHDRRELARKRFVDRRIVVATKSHIFTRKKA